MVAQPVGIEQWEVVDATADLAGDENLGQLPSYGFPRCEVGRKFIQGICRWKKSTLLID
jgi:hypothetical protein